MTTDETIDKFTIKFTNLIVTKKISQEVYDELMDMVIARRKYLIHNQTQSLINQ